MGISKNSRGVVFCFLIASVLVPGLARADGQQEWCAGQVKTAVETQATTDYPGRAVLALVPPFKYDGGFVQTLRVPVADAGNLQTMIAVYTVSIDEVCTVEIQGHQSAQQ